MNSVYFYNDSIPRSLTSPTPEDDDGDIDILDDDDDLKVEEWKELFDISK